MELSATLELSDNFVSVLPTELEAGTIASVVAIDGKVPVKRVVLIKLRAGSVVFGDGEPYYVTIIRQAGFRCRAELAGRKLTLEGRVDACTT